MSKFWRPGAGPLLRDRLGLTANWSYAPKVERSDYEPHPGSIPSLSLTARLSLCLHPR